MIKLAVNARLLQPNRLDGIGVYMHEILSRMVKSHPEIEFHFYFNKPPSNEFKYGENVVFHKIYFPVRHMRMLNLWQNSLLQFAVNKLNPDAMLCMDSLGMPEGSKIKTHLTVHDINFVHRPQDLPKGVRKFYAKNIPSYLKQAHQIATVSDYSRKDIDEQFGIDSSSIDVVYNAPKSIFQPLEKAEIEKVRKQWTNEAPYFVFVGSIHPRKNVKGLIQAYFEFKRKYNGVEKLMIVGDVMWDNSEIAHLNEAEFQDEIILTGRVNDKVLAQLIGAAQALTYIPFFEGFGIPLVEAMAADVPVITSNTTAIPEVAGDAAILCDPHNLHEIAKAMNTVSSNENYRKELIEKGIIRSSEFSWDKSSEVFSQSVKKLL